jgi:hypothetical protein
MPSYTRKVQIPGKTSQELYDVVANDIDRFLSKVNLGKYEIEKNPSSKKIHVKSKLFSATLNCADSEMELVATLSLLAMPFRSKLDESIDRWLTKSFQSTARV